MHTLMKNLKRGAALPLGLVLGLAVGGCDFIEPVETDPNVVPEASVDQLFTGIQVNSYLVAEGQLSRIASIWTQQMAGTDRQFAIIDAYRLSEEDADDEFSAIYTGGGLVDLRDARAQADEAGRSVYSGILKVHEAFLIGTAASVFGAVPYSEAANPEIENPVLDDQRSVYTAVQALLDEAIADLGSGAGAGPGGVDMNFAGDPAAWTAVANTLKARYHIHWAEVDGEAAYTAALAAAAGGIATAEGSWRAIHSSAATENNLWYQFMRDRSGYISGGDYLVPLMDAEGDPRLPLYFDEASGGGYAARDSDLSSTGYGEPAFDFPIVTCAENNFIIAEAQFRLGDEGAAVAAAEAALACQEAALGVDLSAQAAEVASLSGDALFDEIMQQKYIAMFLNVEAWNDYKRTCRPAITERPGGMPARLFYGQQERQTNPNIPAPAQQPSRNDNDPGSC